MGGKAGGPGSSQTLLQAARKAGLLGAIKVPVECQLYVKNLPPDMTDIDLFRLFAPFGAIASSGVKVMCNEDGTCKGFGFVDYIDSDSPQMAANALNGFMCPDGGSIFVSSKINKTAKGAAAPVPTQSED